MQTPQDQLARRLEELAGRAADAGVPVMSGFLSPAEAEWARIAAKRRGAQAFFFGGYEDAERRMACFAPPGDEPPPFPISAVRLAWPHQPAPAHRDVLGAVMALGLKRACVGDIALEEDCGYVFAQRDMAEHIARTLFSAGHTRLQTLVLDELPAVRPPEGREMRFTVSSPRLDAVLDGGFGLSRAAAQELTRTGRVKLRHVLTLKPDERVQPGDAISARGLGRLKVEEIGTPTKKGRLPIRLTRYGESRKA